MSGRYITKNDRLNLLNQFVLLDEQTPDGNGDIVFDDISGDYIDLVAIGEFRSDRTGSSIDGLQMQLGNLSIDTGSNYRRMMFQLKDDNSVDNDHAEAVTALKVGLAVADGQGDANIYGTANIEIIDYSNSSKYKNVHGYGSHMGDAGVTTGIRNVVFGGTWESNSVVDTIKVSAENGALNGDTKIRLYGRGLKSGATVQELSLDGWGPWHVIGDAGEPTFSNGFDHYNVINGGSGYDDVAFRKHTDGMVQIKGLVDGGNSGGNVAVFTLPEDYRPAKNRIFACVDGGDNGNRVDVGSNGVVTIIGYPAEAYQSLEIMYDAA